MATLTPALWIEDFDQLRQEMSSHYANLEWVKDQRRTDLPHLRAETEEALEGVRSDSDARRILSRFVDSFGDGHLEIDWPTTDSSTRAVTRNTGLCERLGYGPRGGAGVAFSMLPHFSSVATTPGTFRAGLLRLPGGRTMGIVRIGVFTEKAYPDACSEAARQLRMTDSAKCDSDCVDRIEIRTANVLTAGLAERVERLRRAGATALLVDITHNGGGSDWVEALARVLSSEPLRGSHLGFIQHVHRTNQLEKALQEVETDLHEGRAPSDVLAAYLVAVTYTNGHWSAAAPLPEPIQELSAAVLHGKIYVAGGIDGSGRPTAVAFRYDSTLNHWERIADLPVARHHMPLAVVGETLYAVGGLAEQTFVPVNTLWLYREDANRWEPRAGLPAPRGASAVGVVNGKLIVAGGWSAGRRLIAATAIYDPATDRWRDAAPIPTPRDHLAAATVGGVVYAIGGRPFDSSRNYDVVEAYDPATDRWTRRSPMPSKRGGLAAAALDGKIDVVGGEARSSVFANHEVYDPAADRWATAPALPTARHGLAAAALGGKLYVIGGGPKPGFAQTGAVDVFTP